MDDTLTLEQSAELLLEDEGFRSGLDDDEARILLDWALGELDAAARHGEALEPVLQRVRQVGRQVNELVGARASLDGATFAARLRALAGLPQPRYSVIWRRWMRRSDAADTLTERLTELDGPALVRALLELATTRPEAS